MAEVKPITIWGHWAGPNPWKVILILEALHLPYDLKLVEFSEVKNDSYTKLNPNGRLPTIEDPNTNITLWEYLMEQYDIGSVLSYKTFPERYLTQQWLAFQISGQGPYIGQATWFARFHPEKIQSAIDRYVAETLRIVGVIETGLERTGTGWLVGSKCTYADLAFVTWATVGEGLLKELKKYDDFETTYPQYTVWIAAMNIREDVKQVKAHMAKGRADHGLPP